MKTLPFVARAAAGLIALYALGVSAQEAPADPAETGYQPPPNTTWRAKGTTYFEELPKTSNDVCNTSQKESPIRIPDATPTQLPDLQFKYEPYNPDTGYMLALNNGHTIQWYFDPDEFVSKPGTKNLYALSSARATQWKLKPSDERGITFDGKYYKLLQMHVHHPSEHVLDGRRFHMEAHFVHGAADTNKLVVVAVLLDSQPETETWYQWLEWSDSIPTLQAFTSGEGLYGLTRRYNPGRMLPPAGSDGKRDYRRYEGSLTTPPCSDIVTWIVLTTPFKIGQKGIDGFKNKFGVNARPLQPLNARAVTKPQ